MARLIRTMLTVMVILGLMVGWLWLGQRRLIYLPDRESPLAPPEVAEVVLPTEEGLLLAAWWLTPADLPQAAVIVFPGNAGNRGGRLPLARALVEEGLGVLLVDYRGYGGNPGSPSEPGLLADARAARRWVDGAGVNKMVYLGESIGSGPATALALETPPSVLVLRSPFTSLADLARVHYPFLPTDLLLRDRFPVVDQVGDVAAVVVVVAGTEDSIVPLSHSQAVADAADAEIIVVDGADHNDPMLASGRQLVDAVVAALDTAGE